MNHSMTWADFYLVCFAVGFCLSFFSFVFGGARVGRLHLPHFHGHIAGAHIPTTTMPTAHAPVAARTPVGVKATAGQAAQQGGVSPFNFVTSTAFLAWFGGTGYLLTRYSGVWVGFGLLASITSGLVGGGIVFLFLSKVLISEDENMDPADYEMVGVLGRICSWDPRGRNWRNDLHANGNAPRVRRPQRRCYCHRQGERSGGHALRKGNCVRSVVERNVGRRVDCAVVSGFRKAINSCAGSV